jgi:hypothetical protein
VLSGVFSFYVFCHGTGEIAAAITTVIHNTETMRLVEVPLCATAAGYKRLGFARLLAAALQALSREHLDAEVMMVTADPHAVPFWEKCGFTDMSRQMRQRLEFYLLDCHKFKDSKLMTWECKSAPEEPDQLVMAALAKMPNIIVASHRLPWVF